MEVHLTQRFEQAYGKLTAAEKRSVVKALTLLGDHPRHPGLRVKKMGGTKNVWNLYSPSISAAGCRYVVVSLGLTSGTPFTGDYHIDNVCITYA